MHQQEVISFKNIYLSGIVLNHLHGVAPLSIWGVRWLGLGPPAVLESYRSLHTLPADKLTPSSKNPLSQRPLRSTHCFFSLFFFFSSMKICLELWSAHDAGLIRFLQQPRHPLLILQRFDWTRVAQCHAEVAFRVLYVQESPVFIIVYI